MKRLKVLISVHELSPIQGSECAEGWNLVRRIARYHDLTVLYARGSQFAPDAYEQALSHYYTEHINEFNIRFIPVPQPKATLWLAGLNKKISGRTSGIGIPFFYFLGYRLWQKSVYRMAHTLVVPFSICHHLNQITFREPGYLWRLPVPFIWGPTGGTGTIPGSYYRHIGLRQSIFEIVRSLSNRITALFGHRISGAIRKSSLVYAFSVEDQGFFIRNGAGRVELMLDSGCDPELADTQLSTTSLIDNDQHIDGQEVKQLRLLWCGQLVKRKALDILIRAIAGDPELIRQVQLTIVGDGPLRKKYEKLVLDLLVQPATCNLQPTSFATFTGWLPHAEVFGYMRSSDYLVHTSYREAASNVIPEALSVGLPVICHEISGMSIAVTDECGIKVPLVSFQSSIRGFREAIKAALKKPSQRPGALGRARELSWDSMAERIAADYHKIAGQS